MRNVLLDVVGHLALESRFHVWGRGLAEIVLNCLVPHLGINTLIAVALASSRACHDHGSHEAKTLLLLLLLLLLLALLLLLLLAQLCLLLCVWPSDSSQQAYVLTTAQQRQLGNKFWLSICTMDALGSSNSQNPARFQQFGATTALTCESNFHLSQKPWLWYFPYFPHTLLNLQLSS